MANVEELQIDLATIASVGSTVALASSGREVSDVYIAEMPAGAPVMLMIGLNAAAGFRGLQAGDSFDCVNRLTCQGEMDGIGVRLTALTAGLFRIAVTYGPGGAGVR
jgi:hypothetical protein